jgi:hypothetical protein
VAALGLQAVLVCQLPEGGRAAPVVRAADLDLGVPGVGEHLEGAGQVELVVRQQVADREQLDADPVERQVTAAGAMPVVVVATVPPARRCGHRSQRSHGRGSTRRAE